MVNRTRFVRSDFVQWVISYKLFSAILSSYTLSAPIPPTVINFFGPVDFIGPVAIS